MRRCKKVMRDQKEQYQLRRSYRESAKKIKYIALLCCVLISLVACSPKKEKVSQNVIKENGESQNWGEWTVQENGSVVRKMTKYEQDESGSTASMYCFRDVEENGYEAMLLPNVPKCTYDFSYLKTDEETGYKSYEDLKRKVTAKFGIDVSEFQGESIDWEAVKSAGVEFVIIRLGYRAYGESGALVLDAMYDRNIQGAIEAGLQVGVYFFSQAISPVEAVEEAEFVLEHLKPYKITGPVVFDTEEIKWDTARTDVNTKQDFTNYCKVFCNTVEHAGYDPVIYANMKWMAFTLDMEQLTEYDFWYADYHETPQCPYEYKIWQYSETGEVPGIMGNVDLNLWFEEDKTNEVE